MRGGTPSDHFGLAAQHVLEGFSQMFQQMCSCCQSASGPGAQSPGHAVLQDDDDDDDDVAIRRQARIAGIILPTDPWKETWDVVILMLIIYSAIMVPYRICFEAGADGVMWWLEQLFTLTFFIDVVFNFNTAFPSVDDSWVLDRREISCRYMQGWFWIDAPSCVPVELIDLMIEGEQSQMGMLRFLRLFRLIRLLRLLKVGEYVATLEERFEINLTFLRIATMLLKLIFLSHILACFWFYTAFLTGLDPDIPTWVSAYDDGSGLDAPPDVQYLYSMYWALTTLTTVGYGDITPTNNTERTYTAVSLLIGALVFGYMLSSIGSLVSALDRQAALSEEKMDAIKEYMRWRHLPRDLTIRMRRYYEYYYEKKTAFDELAILEGLTPSLRFEVVRHSLRETIGRIPLFRKTLDPLFQMEIFPLFKPVSASPREVIYTKGEPSHALFFLLKGKVEAISCMESRVLYSVRQGQSFGESVLTGRQRSATVRAVVTSEMFTISADELQDLFLRRPREGRLMHQELFKEYICKEKTRALALRLFVNRMKLGSDAKSPDTRQTIAAIQMQIVWCRLTENMVLRAMPVHTEPEKLSLSQDIEQSQIAPLEIAGPMSPVAHQMTRDAQALAARRVGAAQYSGAFTTFTTSDQSVPGNKWSSDPADRGSVQALQSDVRQMLGAIVDMQASQRSLQDQVRALSANKGSPKTPPANGPQRL